MTTKLKSPTDSERDLKVDSDSEEKPKKKTKSKVEEVDSSEDTTPKKKKKTKSKVEEVDSSEDTTPKKKKKPKKVESKLDAKSEENANNSEEMDVEKASAKEIKDPLKDEQRLKFTKKCISHLCLLILFMAIRNVVLGLCAYIFYENKTHLIIFGGLCIMQLIGAPVGFYAIKLGNRFLFLTCVIINVVWIISVVILLAWYWITSDKEDQFKTEIALHVGAVFFMAASLALGICCLIMMKKLDMINIQYKQPKVFVSADGKASEKAKNKK